ncbi:metallophosphoesterase family protein [Gloeocapsa sp. PCC 73106]|uniref:purple acid phosphatase family protein n=1 Tax=Gloeocapsa sp. PCC 73106 TaxID=102232 RepID=UPI0002ACDAE0|nr:metallophosphoesterase family protein [Gloeocapsa sp. PCC 73106]ELR99702.1 Calcineurin-like phosphoesterase [Gloeocapsa sp. PCC 73106]
MLRLVVFLLVFIATLASGTLSESTMLTDPFLQLPDANSVRVVWFTEFSGVEHYVIYGEKLAQRVTANTSKLSRVAEDEKSRVDPPYTHVTPRDIWRHEALVTGLIPAKRVPYRVVSKYSSQEITSRIFSLAPKPPIEANVKILLTSDHQLMPMTAANLQQVAALEDELDGIFLAGDLVNIPDRASEWFDDRRGGAFFPCLQGRANYQLTSNGVTNTYRGGELIQHIPLFPAIGNHEVMGRFSSNLSLNEQFDASFPREAANATYQRLASEINPLDNSEIKANWLKNYSFNTDTYHEIFTLPGEKYYSLTFGNLWLGVLYVTNMWRSPSLNPEITGRYQERTLDLNNPENWGYGQHIFESIAPESEQYRWLAQELQSEAFSNAKYKMVMFHHPPHSLGGNVVPPYTQPRQKKHYDEQGNLQRITYDYPQAEDYIIRDLVPLLASAGVDLVFYGHSHLWNRFYDPSTNLHFLESSNVGNSYGAYWGDSKNRPLQESKGNPNGLEAIVPTIAPLATSLGVPLPYIASNDLTVFSILDTSKGSVSSYRFDTQDAQSPIIKFDEFVIGEKR